MVVVVVGGIQITDVQKPPNSICTETLLWKVRWNSVKRAR